MLRFAKFWPVVACAITGAALYVTRGVNDEIHSIHPVGFPF